MQPQTFEIEGRLFKKFVSNPFAKCTTREFVLKIFSYTRDDEDFYSYPTFKCITFEKTAHQYDYTVKLNDWFEANDLQQGDILRVKFRLDGSPWEPKDGSGTKYMTNLRVEKIEMLQAFTEQEKVKKEKPSVSSQVNAMVPNSEFDQQRPAQEDDLPFNLGSR